MLHLNKKHFLLVIILTVLLYFIFQLFSPLYSETIGSAVSEPDRDHSCRWLRGIPESPTRSGFPFIERVNYSERGCPPDVTIFYPLGTLLNLSVSGLASLIVVITAVGYNTKRPNSRQTK